MAALVVAEAEYDVGQSGIFQSSQAIGLFVDNHWLTLG
tara:strand:+ start:370 stop:483 length:114 start_codon:yes stop_codon:yes gene_type:complete